MTNNTANSNSSYGFYVYDCYDANYAGGLQTGSHIIGNTANDGSTGFYGYYLYNAVWKSNTANYTTDDGFYFDYPIQNVAMFNTALHNGDNGFYITDNNSYYNFDNFSSNTANHNFDYGFTAGYGVPGTGNIGKHNYSGNCYNVDCN